MRGDSATSVTADYLPGELDLEAYVKMIFRELQPNQIDANAVQVGGGKPSETNTQIYQRAMKQSVNTSPDDVDDNLDPGFDISGIFTLPIDWDVLASASDSCLDGHGFTGYVNKKIVNKLAASVTYRIWQDDLGELGTVEIRKLRDGLSQIEISGVDMNAVDTARMWLKDSEEWETKVNDAIGRIPRDETDETLGFPRHEVIKEYVRVSNDRDRARARILAKQKNHQADVIRGYASRLLQEPIWTTKNPPQFLCNFVDAKEIERIWPFVSLATNDQSAAQASGNERQEASPKIVNANWRDIVRKINGVRGLEGWNTVEGLGMVFRSQAPGPRMKGAALWDAGNCSIIVNSWNENSSLVELRTDKEPANAIALETWKKLQELLMREYSKTDFKQALSTLPSLTGAAKDFIRNVAINTTSIVVSDEIRNKPLEELQKDSARFHLMRDGKMGDNLQETTEPQKQNGEEPKPHKIKVKSKELHMPTRRAEKRKWALLWEFYDKHYKLQKLNATQFRVEYELYDGYDKPRWMPQDNETLNNIIDEGNKGHIPKYEDVK